MKLSRRNLLGASVSAVGAGGLGLLTPNASAQMKWKGKRPKNVIFVVVDGMAMQTLSLADALTKANGGKSSYWTWLMGQPFAHNALQETRSLTCIVTDSAAASSSWGSGRRIVNGQINQFPDGTELRTLMSLMNDKKVRTGLVTTTTMTHATPAGFAVSIVNRDLEALIAEKYLTSGIDVLLGGGNRFFAADKRPDKKDVYAEFAKQGYEVVKTRDQLMASRGKKVLGIFSDSHLPFTIDRNNNPELQKTVPTLAEMTKHAINELKNSRNGFLLQVEGGKVDHAGHANDLGAIVWEQLAFEEAVKVAVEFALEDKETLVIITADHATGGPSLNGAGEEYIESNMGLQRINGMKASYDVLRPKMAAAKSASDLQDVISTLLGLQLSSEEAQGILDAGAGKSPLKMSQFLSPAGMTLGNILGNHSKVTWTSGNHTAEHVFVTALGPGSEQVTGLLPNYHFFDLMLAAKGMQHENPKMDAATASKAMEKLKASIDRDWLDFYSAREDDHAHDHGF